MSYCTSVFKNFGILWKVVVTVIWKWFFFWQIKHSSNSENLKPLSVSTWNPICGLKWWIFSLNSCSKQRSCCGLHVLQSSITESVPLIDLEPLPQELVLLLGKWTALPGNERTTWFEQWLFYNVASVSRLLLHSKSWFICCFSGCFTVKFWHAATFNCIRQSVAVKSKSPSEIRTQAISTHA